MPSISFWLSLAIVCAISLLFVDPQCLRDGNLTLSCLSFTLTPAAMSATLFSVPASILKQYSKASSATTLKSLMSNTRQRAYSTKPQAIPSFTYRLAAASAGKRTPPRPPKRGQDFWNHASTHPSPAPPYLRSTKKDSGEDAFFATTVGGSRHHVAFGVADGVGGWQDQGVDPSDFSHGLCGLMAGTAHLHEGLKQDGRVVRPLDLLQTAYDAVISNPRIMAGGCTASLAVADGDGGMETANLGDSGFLIFSPGKVAHRSAVQTHAFNTPYQMSKIPAKMQAQHAIFGGSTQLSDTPRDADVESHQLKHGDLVVFATDGVWDNLSAQDTLRIITRVMEEQGHWFKSHNFPGAETMLNTTLISSMPQVVEEHHHDAYLPGLLATAVMREAKMAGLDRRRDGPFAKEVKMRYPEDDWQGGKPDDIAVVVCVAVEGSGEDGVTDDRPIKAKL